MDLTSPLSSLIPTLDAVALEVLSGTHGALGPSKVHQLARRGSRQGIVNSLERLAEHGLVFSEATNYGYMYRLNRDHLLVPAVLLAGNARRELFNRIATECASLDPTPISAIIFGSLARDDSTAASDIDLLLILEHQPPDLEEWNERLYHLSLKVESWTGNPLQIITRDLRQIAALLAANEPIMDAWKQDGITIFGLDFDKVLVRATQMTEHQ